MENKKKEVYNSKNWLDFSISGNIRKLLSHRQFLEQKRTPISCQFILTNRCNLKCGFCCNKNRDQSLTMDTADAFKALEDLKKLGCKGVEFTGGSEPTMHKDFVIILEKCIKLGMVPALTTNGILLNKVPKDLLAQLDWLRISINSSKKHYKKVHGFNLYDKVIKGLEYVNNLAIPNKGVSYIFYNETTLDDVQELIDELQAYNLDYFRFSLDVFNNPKIASMSINTQFESKKFNIICHSDRETRVPEKCKIFYYKPVIDCSGFIYPCCTNQHKEIHPLGRIQDLLKIWEKGNINIDTSKCEYCIFGETNDFIVNMEQAEVKNINFI